MANIQINYYNGSTYEILYPYTLGSLVFGAVSSATTASSCTGNSATATSLQTSRTIRTNLSSTSTASFDGTANIAPGVTGTLGVNYGGTGVTSYSALATQLNSYMSGAQSIWSFYSGTGTKTTISLNTGFKPNVIFIQSEVNVGTFAIGVSPNNLLTYWYSSGNSAVYAGNTLKWNTTNIQLTTDATSSGLNKSNDYYYWIAIK